MTRLMLATAAMAVAASQHSAALQPSPIRTQSIACGEAGLCSLNRAEQGELVRGRISPRYSLKVGGVQVPVAPDGSFVVGFDRDAPGRLHVELRAPPNLLVPHTVTIKPRNWNIQHVDVARNLPREGDASWARREAEVLRINAARERATGAEGWRQDFIWPARGRISGRFGSQRIYRGEPGSYHGGVDVAVGAGAPVVAPADGVVVLAAGGFSLEGNLVIIDHGHRLSSAFLHLSRIGVSEGQTVRQGEPIGAVGATGRATGPHLHWSLTWNEAKLDPERVVGPMN